MAFGWWGRYFNWSQSLILLVNLHRLGPRQPWRAQSYKAAEIWSLRQSCKMSKTLRGSNLQIKSYQRFKCVYCDILTVSIRCHEFFSRFFGCLRLPKLFHRYSLYCVSLKTLLFAMVKVDQWSLHTWKLDANETYQIVVLNHWHYNVKNLANDGFDNLD